MRSASQPPDDHPRPSRRWVWLLGGCVLWLLLIGLGIWQLQRLTWKQALIERVELRTKSAATPLPSPADWAAVGRETHEYQRVQLQGVLAHDLETLVQASTTLGPGWWVMTPLRLDSGDWVLVNRGFVDAKRRDRAARDPAPSGLVQLQGLIRVSEPEGRLWQRNDAATGRWYARDVPMMATARGLQALGGRVAPFFVDQAADASAPPDSPTVATTLPGPWPRPGLTVLNFRNNHLMYALTWFTLAAMLACGLVMLWRSKPDPQQGGGDEVQRADV